MPSRILSPQFLRVFVETLTTTQQRQAVDALKDIIAELEDDMDDVQWGCTTSYSHCSSLASEYMKDEEREYAASCDHDGEGLPSCYGTTSSSTSTTDGHTLGEALERCYWQLVQFLRYSRPTRIAEAEPFARTLLASKASIPMHSTNGLPSVNAKTLMPIIYLAAALSVPSPTSSRRPFYLRRDIVQTSDEPNARETEALALFSLALGCSNSCIPGSTSEVQGNQMSAKNYVWAGACYSGLLSRLGRKQDAEAVRGKIRSYIATHPFSLSTPKYQSLVAADTSLYADEVFFRGIATLHGRSSQDTENQQECYDPGSEEEEFDKLPPLSPCSTISTSSLSSGPCSPVLPIQSCSPHIIPRSLSSWLSSGGIMDTQDDTDSTVDLGGALQPLRVEKISTDGSCGWDDRTGDAVKTRLGVESAQ